jgi:guanylate kinase
MTAMADAGAGKVQRRGLMLVLSSPSGAGKTTLSRMLLDEKQAELSVSVTTRAQRPGEIDGQHYHFIDKAKFEEMVRNNELLEWATVFGNSYGTPRRPVEDALKAGRDMLFDLDWQGTQQMRQRAPKDLVSIFILPPSVPELERRLHTRAQDDEATIKGRMAKAGDEMSHWPEYDYIVVNHDLLRSLDEIRSILAAERLKRERQTGLVEFVRGLQAQL